MDKNLYVKDITNGSDVSSLFLIKRSDLRSKRGEQFVHMTLADRTGTIECKAYGNKAVERAACLFGLSRDAGFTSCRTCYRDARARDRVPVHACGYQRECS